MTDKRVDLFETSPAESHVDLNSVLVMRFLSHDAFLSGNLC